MYTVTQFYYVILKTPLWIGSATKEGRNWESEQLIFPNFEKNSYPRFIHKYIYTHLCVFSVNIKDLWRCGIIAVCACIDTMIYIYILWNGCLYLNVFQRWDQPERLQKGHLQIQRCSADLLKQVLRCSEWWLWLRSVQNSAMPWVLLISCVCSLCHHSGCLQLNR